MKRMRRAAFPLPGKSLALGLAVFLVPLICAANGRDFAGFYALTDAAPAGQNYTITFSARVFNYSGAAVTDATLLLRGCPSPAAPCNSFPNISISP